MQCNIYILYYDDYSIYLTKSDAEVRSYGQAQKWGRGATVARLIPV